MRHAFALLLLCLAPMPLLSQGLPAGFERIKEGLSQHNVRCILQDRYGFLWFGTRNGLNQYDGYGFSLYERSEQDSTSLGHNWVTDLLELPSGDIWVATYGGGISVLRRETGRFKRYEARPDAPNSLSHNVVLSLLRDKNGHIWAGTAQGICRYLPEKDGFESFTAQNTPGLLNDNAIDLAEDGQGRLWIATPGAGLACLNWQARTATMVQHHPQQAGGLAENSILALAPSRDGGIWIGTSASGLQRMTADGTGSYVFERYAYDPMDPQSISGNSILSIHEDRKGHLWVGTENAGLSVMAQPGVFERFANDPNDPSSLPDNSVWAIAESQEGIVWIGTFAEGLAKVDARRHKFRQVRRLASQANSLSHQAVNAFLEDDAGNIWVGTDGGGLNYYQPAERRFLHLRHRPDNPQSLGSDAVIGLMRDRGNRLWVTTWGGGISVVADVNDPKSPVSRLRDWFHYFDLAEDREGIVWAASWGLGVHGFDASGNQVGAISYTEGSPDSELSHGNVFCLQFDSAQRLWIGTLNGLNIATPKPGGGWQVRKAFHDDEDPTSIAGNVVFFLFQDRKGRLWAGTDNGLCLYQGDGPNGQPRFRRFGKEDGFPSTAVQTMEEDEQGQYWVSTSKGLTLFDGERALRSYTASDGLQPGEFRRASSLRLRDGQLLFGGSEGFNLFHPKEIQDNPVPPPVYITDFKIFNRPVPIGQEGSPLRRHILLTDSLVLSYEHSVFSFEFVGLGYTHSEQNQYAFRLEGLEREWNEVGARRTASYSNLNPGTYTFMVKAANNDGVWSPPRTLVITVTPPFWKTAWFMALAWLLAIAAAVAFYKLRVRHLKRQREKLSRLVKIRTAELEAANQSLEAQKAEITAQHQELLQQAEEIAAQRDKIEQQHLALEHSYQELTDKSTQITDSIRYAQTIQEAILPAERELAQAFADHFVLYRPKDIVSGDFYWMLSLQEDGQAQHFLAVVDCTGHGVPGAFMSMVGSRILNEVILQKQRRDPAGILDLVDESIRVALKQSGNNTANTDGMDIGLLRLTPSGQGFDALFAGAKNTAWHCRQSGECTAYKGDNLYVGGPENTGGRRFSNHAFAFVPGDMLYLVTDGFADQHSGASRQKFGTNRLHALLESIAEKPCPEQREALAAALLEHQQEAEQRDDITLIGIRG
jgi:ligand-binding sensor domain-containing protein/serine phosphatase RsbU (regulator of sigma subunit)